MNWKDEQRLLTTLELIENDLETLALAILATVPPLVQISLANMPGKADELIEIINGLGDAHEKGAIELRSKLQQDLNDV